MAARQSTCVAIAGRAMLIEGPPGSGKSSLALALLDRGAQLIGDDSVMLDMRDGRLCASPHPATRGKLEVRNLGLLDWPVCEGAPVALLLLLDAQAPRYVEAAETVRIEGIGVPALRLWPGSPVLHLRAELALTHFGMAG